MSKVRLLLSTSLNMQNYIDGFNGVGAEPSAFYLPEIDTSYDGLVLCGGGDIDPKYYNEKIDGCGLIDKARDEAEFALLKAYFDAGKPIMGICRGCQILNVFFGGSLYQHLPKSEHHQKQNNVDKVHELTSPDGTILRSLYGERYYVNSAHHQAVKQLGEGLRVGAVWKNVYVEAIEHSDYPIFGLQLHPERMCFKNKREDTVSGAPVLDYFVGLCEKQK